MVSESQKDGMDDRKSPEKPPLLTRGLIFVTVFGLVLMFYGTWSGYVEYSRLKPAIDAGWDVATPAYPSLVFLGGAFLVLYVLFDVVNRLFHRIRQRLRLRSPKQSPER
jgi:hypothetical protein